MPSTNHSDAEETGQLKEDSDSFGTEFPMKYSMIPTTFTERISVSDEGERIERTFNSVCRYESEYPASYCTGGEYALRQIPVLYTSTVVANEDSVLYSDSMTFAPQVKCLRQHETIVTSPRTVTRKYISTLTHWANYKERRYLTGVIFVPVDSLETKLPEKVSVATFCNGVQNGIDSSYTEV